MLIYTIATIAVVYYFFNKIIIDVCNIIASELVTGHDYFVHFAEANAVIILGLLLLAYCILNALKKNRTVAALFGGDIGFVMSQMGSNRSASREEQMIQARLRQQELAEERAKQAAIEREEREREEKHRKNQAAIHKSLQGGDLLGNGKDKKGGNGDDNDSTKKKTKTSSSTGGRSQGYNPMQPGSSHVRGYRPARRTVGRS